MFSVIVVLISIIIVVFRGISNVDIGKDPYKVRYRNNYICNKKLII
jgi:hypothetical protein